MKALLLLFRNVESSNNETNIALWTLFGVIIGAILTGIINFILQRSQFKHNKEMYLLRNQSKENVKEIIQDLLNHRTNIDRSFVAIRSRIGGYSNDEIRQLLHEVGAKKVLRKNEPLEWWYLKVREKERIEKRKDNKA